MTQDKGGKQPRLVVHLDDGTMLRRLENGTYAAITAVDEIAPDAIARHERRRSRKKSITLRIDEDLLSGYRAQGKGWQTLMHSVLRAYYEDCLRG